MFAPSWLLLLILVFLGILILNPLASYPVLHLKLVIELLPNLLLFFLIIVHIEIYVRMLSSTTIATIVIRSGCLGRQRLGNEG